MFSLRVRAFPIIYIAIHYSHVMQPRTCMLNKRRIRTWIYKNAWPRLDLTLLVMHLHVRQNLKSR